ncbi:MAG: YcxB family protein [Flexibacteraceae bacterium]
MLSGKTKKYKVDIKTYIRHGLEHVFRKWWWAFLVPIGIILPGLYFTGALVWLILAAVLITGLYILFWYIQFYGLQQLPQGKMVFEKYSYEFDNNNLLVKLNQKEGMPIKYDQIQLVKKKSDALLIFISPIQFFYLPYSIFNSDADIKITESILKRKNLL